MYGPGMVVAYLNIKIFLKNKDTTNNSAEWGNVAETFLTASPKLR